MAQTNADLSKQLVEQGAKNTSLVLQGQLEAWKKLHFRKLASIAGNHETAERMFVICLNTMSRSTKLLECTFPSLVNCIMQSFQLGLYPGPLKECAYVPLKNGRTGELEANFWPQYQGIVKLMVNGGARCVVSRVVYEGDSFVFREGLEPPIYCPAVVNGVERGDRRFVFGAVCTQSGMWQVEVLSPAQIGATKARSRGAQTKDSPWNSSVEDDINWMWRKTAIIQVGKLISKSPELAAAIEADNEIDGDKAISNKTTIVELAPRGKEQESEATAEEETKKPS